MTVASVHVEPQPSGGGGGDGDGGGGDGFGGDLGLALRDLLRRRPGERREVDLDDGLVVVCRVVAAAAALAAAARADARGCTSSLYPRVRDQTQPTSVRQPELQ